jgi:hypothetical protein
MFSLEVKVANERSKQERHDRLIVTHLDDLVTDGSLYAAAQNEHHIDRKAANGHERDEDAAYLGPVHDEIVTVPS